MKALETLSLCRNKFFGAVPDEALANLKNLAIVNLAENKLTGPLPTALLAAPALEWCSLEDNDFAVEDVEAARSVVAGREDRLAVVRL